MTPIMIPMLPMVPIIPISLLTNDGIYGKNGKHDDDDPNRRRRPGSTSFMIPINPIILINLFFPPHLPAGTAMCPPPNLAQPQLR